PDAGLREAARVLRDAGRAGTVTWAGETQPAATTVWDQTLQEFGVPTIPAHGNHEGLDTVDAIDSRLQRAGLRPVDIWIEPVEHRFSGEEFFRLRTSCGCNRARLDALDTSARHNVLTQLRTRLASLAPSEYVFRGEVVCSISTRQPRKGVGS